MFGFLADLLLGLFDGFLGFFAFLREYIFAWMEEGSSFMWSAFADLVVALKEWIIEQLPTDLADRVNGVTDALGDLAGFYEVAAWFFPITGTLAIVVWAYSAAATVRLVRHLCGLYPGSLG